jgi:hypothetical protein
MTIFSKLFGKRPVESKTTAIHQATEPEKPVVPRDLFIEDRDPSFFEADTRSAPKIERSLLQDILSLDYEAMGRTAGYSLHDLGRMDEQLDKIASEFRLAYARAIQDLDIEMDGLERHITDRLEAETPDTYRRIKGRYDLCVREKRELMLQRDLAVTGEGYMEKATRYFQSGFRAGYDLYIEEKLLFKHPKTV